jgi:gamma-glutamylcyclotransferase (GGCT)/AIG2-like uncharacterized protein YtfP
MRTNNVNINHLTNLSTQGKLYLGYGSNLNSADLKSRSVSLELKPLTKTILPDTELVFDKSSNTRKGGVLSLKTTKGAAIQAMLFEINDWPEMDKKEGGYTRIPVVCQITNDTQVHEVIAWTYATTASVNFQEPHPEYMKVLKDGYTDHGIDYENVIKASEQKFAGYLIGTNHIFTYGTLCRGESREAVMRQGNPDQVGMADLFSHCLVECAGGAYPGIISDSAKGDKPPYLNGDLWFYTNNRRYCELIEQLDQIEGHRSLSIRETVRLVQNEIKGGVLPNEACKKTQELLMKYQFQSLYRRYFFHIGFDAKKHFAWLYHFNQPIESFPVIESGNWRIHIGRWQSCLETIANNFISHFGDVQSASDQLTTHSFSTSFRSAEDLVSKLKTKEIDENNLSKLLRSSQG